MSGFVLVRGGSASGSASFSPGQWDQCRDAFLDLLRTFQFEVPPTITAVPIGRPPPLLRSGTYWPIG